MSRLLPGCYGCLGMSTEIHCSVCAAANRPGRLFCAACGAALAVPCADCGAANEPGDRFCGGCGAALTAPDAARPAARDGYTPPHLARQILHSRSALQGERKQVTVLFADVKGSMHLAESSGMETWHAILDEFFRILGEGVHRFEGTVNQYTGDGIMALFGAPLAREDHAQRACFAALYLQEKLQQYALDLRRSSGLDFAVRMGLNSGEVVVGKIGDDLRMDYTAQGHTVGLAQRMEQLAAADRIYVTEQVAERVAGFFDLVDLGRFEVKGVGEAVRVLELRGVGAMRTRLDVSRARGFSRFVGRAPEMDVLRAAREEARQGRGQVVCVVGEPGIGKSRLCLEFLAECRARGCEVHEARAVAHGQSVSYLPVLEFLRSYFGISERDDDRVAREKVAGRMLIGDESLRDDLPLLFDFLGIRDAAVAAQRLDPDSRLRRQFGAVRKLLERREGDEARVVLFEDLHWIDGGSGGFVESLVDAVPATRTLLVVNFRGEYEPPWSGLAHERRLPLAPLGRAAADELLVHLIGDDAKTARLREKIRERTSGNPFFVEEVVRSMAERGELVGERGAYRLRHPRQPLVVPESVQTVLAARIDRLGERDKLILQTAAVIGRHVPEPVLARVVDLPRAELVAGLQALVDAELLVEEELFPEARFAFQHPLTREVAYGSQLETRRRVVHAAVARAIAAHYADGLHERAALLAHHWDRAGEPLEAARWYRGAARWAGVSDSEQSLRHWRAVRTCLVCCGETEETLKLGVEACRAILNLDWRRGLVDEVEEVFTEGRQLAERAGDFASQAILLNLYGNVRGVAGDLAAYLDYARRALRVAEKGDPGVRSVLALDLAIASFHAGQLRTALDLVAAGRDEAADPEREVEVFGWRAATYAAVLRGWFASEDGRLVDAQRELARAHRLARLHQEPEMELMAYSLQSYTASVAGEVRTALNRARRAVQLGERAGNRAYRAGAWWVMGLANLIAGRWDDAARALEQAAGDGFLMGRGRGIANQAEVRLGLGDIAGARALVDEALRVAVESHSPRCECYAQLTLARLLRRAEGAAAEARVRTAIAAARAVAEHMGAAIYEPFLLYEESRLAAVLGDGEARREKHAAALASFRAVGASGYVEFLSRAQP